MKSTVQLSNQDLIYKIQMKPLAVSEKELAHSLDRARFDPRLFEVVTEFIRDFWWNLNPTFLNKACRKSGFPFMVKASINPILEYCQMKGEDKKNFSNWVIEASKGLKLPPPQLLYIGLHPVGSSIIQEELKQALPCFKKLNLISKDLPFNKSIPGDLKSEHHPAPNRTTEVELLKAKLARKIKALKLQGLSNEEIINSTGINRVFLSKILNNKLERITAEYLQEHTHSIEEISSRA